ncbi:DUF2147 domain-containing protein [Methylobacterium sp. ID0610]|uniref:DUF2147 domain-containing protein n=1 Tax=Methylobacterium carpenticola TaxID=3344827 RepID=UPI0036D07B6D
MQCSSVRKATVLAAAFLGLGPALARAAEPLGTWLTEDGRARVRTEHCGPQNAHLCGYVVWMRKPKDDDGKMRLDRENPDPQKQARQVVGHQMLLGLKRNDAGRYEGKVYNADNGKFYDVQVWSETAGELTVKGCMLALFCGSQSWKQVADVLPGQLEAPTNAPGGPRADKEWAPKTPPGATPAAKVSAPR